MAPIYETKTLIYQSTANLGVKIFFGNATHLIHPEIRKMLERSLNGCQDSLQGRIQTDATDADASVSFTRSII